MKQEIRLVKRQELGAVTALWQTCFGDPPQEVKAFWDALYDHIQVFALWQGASPQSMLCALPLTLVDQSGQELPSVYFYAICTAPEARKQGFCRALMAFAEAHYREKGAEFSCLVPAQKALFSFYEALGYETVFWHRLYRVSAAAGAAAISELTAQGYQNLRQMQLYDAFTDYPLPLLEWERRMAKAGGGGLFRVETPEGIFCAAAEKNADFLHIKELLPDSPEAAAALATHLKCREAQVRTPGTELPFGMAKSLSGRKMVLFSYLGLAFDG